MDAFSSRFVSPLVLQHLLKHEAIETFTPSKSNQELKLYVRNSKANYFILIVSGSGEVIVGNENLKYIAQTFSYFGNKAILSNN